MTNIQTFKKLFDKYRLKSNLPTFSEFGKALAEEGCIYEDSIFSKWKNGDRKPSGRKVALAILRVFIKYKGINSIEEANELLRSLELRDLEPEEHNNLSIRLEAFANPYSRFKPVSEPNILLDHININTQNISIKIIEEIKQKHIQNHWRYLELCAITDYYASTSSGKINAHELFDLQYSQNYDKYLKGLTLIATVTDLKSGQEYFAGSIRYMRGTPNNSPVLDIMNYYKIQGNWPHESLQLDPIQVADLDRFIIQNWAWAWKKQIVRMLFHAAFRLIQQDKVTFAYSMMSSRMQEIIVESGISLKEIRNAEFLGSLPNAQAQYPTAYFDYTHFPKYWSIHAKLYQIIPIISQTPYA